MIHKVNLKPFGVWNISVRSHM